ncbi:hypothetical protein IHE33_01955 [Mycetohabitans endofungorum]|uniref:hypothetical protein n=1 Tax=Mycetohabitans endofungorum TaxID=417203 RepID=UPI00324D3693
MSHSHQPSTQGRTPSTGTPRARARTLGASLALLVEGVYTASQTFDPRCDVIASAPTLAAQLIDAATAPSDADAR